MSILREAWTNLWDFVVVRDRQLMAEMSDVERAAVLRQIKDDAWVRARVIEREQREIRSRYGARQSRSIVVAIKGWGR